MNETKYKPEYCQGIIDHMSKGYSYSSYGAIVNCGITTLYDWEKRHPEWVIAKKTAVQKAKNFFEVRLMAKVSGMEINTDKFKVKNIDTSCLIFALKTRFFEDYGDKSKVENTHDLGGKAKRLVIDMGAEPEETKE